MTRFAIDSLVAVRLVREGRKVPDAHRLVAPNVLRSQALSIVYRSVRVGEIADDQAPELLDRLTTMHIRLLGDRVSRGTAWKLATTHGWDDTVQAEYVAVALLQADALVTLDPDLAQRADGLVPLASFGDLLRG